MEQQRENDRVVEQLTQRQAEVAQANNQIQLLENRSVKAAEEVEVRDCDFSFTLLF